MIAKIVLGLGFGDEGKGITTARLCQYYENPVVVRFSGGQQAGHTVMTQDTKHVFSNFGSGTLQGVPSYFSEHTSIYLNTIYREKTILESKGFSPRLIVHPLTKVTTPYDVAYNRVMEKKTKHGSVGLGIAATMKRHNETGYKLFAIDFTNRAILNQKLANIKDYYIYSFQEHNDLASFMKEIQLEEEDFFHNLDYNSLPFEIKDYMYLLDYHTVIFEGSQGILLDMDHGIFPNVTWGNTTSKNAMEICNNLGIDEIDIHYVTRCYQTRHGNGWMSNNTPIQLINNSEETCVSNEWQGDLRIGEFDYDLINYALKIDEQYIHAVNLKILHITCMDQRPDWKYDSSRVDRALIVNEQVSPRVEDVIMFTNTP